MSAAVELVRLPRSAEFDPDEFDTRLAPRSRQYLVLRDGRAVGNLVKLYQPGMVAARGCVGGSYRGWWEWYFFNDDPDGPEFSIEYLKDAPLRLSWELAPRESSSGAQGGAS